MEICILEKTIGLIRQQGKDDTVYEYGGECSMARTVGIGQQDFADIRRDKLFYIDKTKFIKEWWESKDSVTLITRPRRFGKTLTMSMLEEFFSVKYEGKSELFQGLEIWQEEKYRSMQGTWPGY